MQHFQVGNCFTFRPFLAGFAVLPTIVVNYFYPFDTTAKLTTTSQPQCGETRNSLPRKIFFVKSIFCKITKSKTLIWRKFSEKNVAVISVHNFQCVNHSGQKFRESNSFTEEVAVAKELLSRYFFRWERNSRVSTLCSFKIPSNQLFTKNFTLNWFDEKNLHGWQWIFCFFTLHSEEKWKI